MSTGFTENRKKRILVLYASNSVHTSTVKDYLDAFTLYSAYEVLFADAVGRTDVGVPFDHFDGVFVHYSVRLSVPGYFLKEFAFQLEKYRGPKILMIQDEYENTELARKWMDCLKFDLVLTVVPTPYIRAIYPKERYPKTEFKNVLTGYVPEWLTKKFSPIPIANRKLDIVYRGRALHFFYGQLGREKEQIGVRVKKLAREAGLKTDIETDDSRRIYGDGWFDFLRSSKTTLGSESGANIFDLDGTLRKRIDRYTAEKPSATYEELQEGMLKGLEGQLAIMNQISPKMFEAIACGTVLVMFEGTYSEILVPDVHYLALKKDFSNWASVLEKLRDDVFLQAMADRASRDIVESRKWSYEKFIQQVDQDFDRISRPLQFSPIGLERSNAVYAFLGQEGDRGYVPNCFNKPVSSEFISTLQLWSSELDLSKCEHFDLKYRVWLTWKMWIPLWLRTSIGVPAKVVVKKLMGLPV